MISAVELPEARGRSRRDIVSSRRDFVKTGLQALLLGLMRRPGMAAPLSTSLFTQAAEVGLSPALSGSRPFLSLPRRPDSVLVGGLPFASVFFGDPWSYSEIPFHSGETVHPGGVPPAPTESVDIAIVGGGLSGLATAYLLRHRRPVVFELRDRFGGVSQGEIWEGTSYSQGGAYFITPDEGTWLESFYRELGMDRAERTSAGDADPMEIAGVIHDDFWTTAAGLPPDEADAIRRYAEMVLTFTERYPDIPLDETQDNGWILDLDQRSLKDDIEARLGRPAPPLLAAGIQSYCYSSFTAGWEVISAASGWNFLAAEEFGRWVCPGGNAWVTDRLWGELVKEYGRGGRGDLSRLRPGTRAVDVRFAGDGRVQVTYKDAGGGFHALLANKVVMACSKHIAKYMLPELPSIDPEKANAMYQVTTNPYVVANVLLDAPIQRDFYDLFLLGDGDFPRNEGEVSAHSRVTDVLNGHFARRSSVPRSVLTLYWPLPWAWARFTLIDREPAWSDYAGRLAPQIDGILALLDVPRASVRQVRMTRWGHAMPIAYPGFIASGTAQQVRRPIRDRIYFVNQDNWSLPAFETCLLEAKTWADVLDGNP
jgi:hypothetical protein